MAKFRAIITGDRELTRALNNIGGRKAMAEHNKALRRAAYVIHAWAKNILPVRSGLWRRNLVVRAVKRSRKGPRFLVTQRFGVDRAGTKGNQSFYATFQELGWLATGRSRTKDVMRGTMPTESEARKKTLEKKVTTYRGRTFSVAQLRNAKKIPGRWLMRRAGIVKEDEAFAIYYSDIRSFIESEAGK